MFVANLILPEMARIQLTAWEGTREVPIRLPNVIFCVRAFARRKNDYHLAPFFSNQDGIVLITKSICEIFAEAELETGIMDYSPISSCYSFVEIYPWNEQEVKNAIEGRKLWGIIRREKELWEFTDELIQRYKNSSNYKLRESVIRNVIRDEWDGNKQEYEYTYQISLKD
jgi:hypothetical protein